MIGRSEGPRWRDGLELDDLSISLCIQVYNREAADDPADDL
jgi:hypothetical protein